MSSMLEQAIVDAKALKEAAIKNAESAIVDKYQDEVRQAMDTLLEQEEELDLGLDEQGEDAGLTMSVPGAAGGEAGGELSLDAPDAFADSEKLCACPEEDEEITIDFDQLRQEMEAEEDVGGPEAALGLQDNVEDEEIDLVQEDLESLIKEITEELTVDLAPVSSGTFGTNKVEAQEAEDFALAGMRDEEKAEEVSGRFWPGDRCYRLSDIYRCDRGHDVL